MWSQLALSFNNITFTPSYHIQILIFHNNCHQNIMSQMFIEWESLLKECQYSLFLARLSQLWTEWIMWNEREQILAWNALQILEWIQWLTFVVVSVAIGIIAFSINFIVLFITQVNARREVWKDTRCCSHLFLLFSTGCNDTCHLQAHLVAKVFCFYSEVVQLYTEKWYH